MVITATEVSRLAGCQGKKKFNTFSQAQRIAGFQARNKDCAFTAYHCRFCGAFHVGTNDTGGVAPEKVTAGMRKPYAVYAAHGIEPSVKVGHSRYADGRDVLALLGPGWALTSVRLR